MPIFLFPFLAHSRTFDPIYYVYNYISDDSSPYYDKFIRRPINGNHDDLVNLKLNMSVHYCPIKKGNSIFETVEL